MAKNKNKNKDKTPKMTVAEILAYFEHYFDAEEIKKFANSAVVEDFLQYLLKRRYGLGENFNSNGFMELYQAETPDMGEAVIAEREKIIADELAAAMEFIQTNPQEEIKRKFDEIERVLIRCADRDTYETYLDFKELIKIIGQYSSGVRPNDLLLYCAYRSQTNLYTFSRSAEVYTGRKNERVDRVVEYYDGKGDILISSNGVDFDRRSNKLLPDYVEPFNRKKMCSDSVKKMFKAQKELIKTVKKDKIRNLKLRFKTEIENDKYTVDMEEYGFTDLDKALHTKTVWHNIDYAHIDKWIKEGLVTPEEIIQAFNEGKILPRDLAIINELGILPQITEATKDNPEVLKNKLFAKLLLFSQDELRVEQIEALLVDEPELRDDLTEEMLEELSWSFTNIDTRHSLFSLLVHDVLDYDQSMVFIDKLKKAGKLREGDEEFLKKGIHDFKVSQLDNLTKSEPFDSTGGGGISPRTAGRLTIDPQLRAKYFEDIGGVKSIFINGSRLINDEEGKNKKNSLDGYQLLVFPDKGVAVLEKFFETTHKDGKVDFKRDENGDLIPAVENATYVIPIEKAVEYATRKNKKDLRSMKRGAITVYHSRNWVKQLEAAMKEIAPEYAKFSKNKTDEWTQIIKEDYEQRL